MSKYFVSYVCKKNDKKMFGNTVIEYDLKSHKDIKEAEGIIQIDKDYDPYVVILNIVKLEE
jgi:hypothetical protein